MEITLPRGTKDYGPEEKILLDSIISKIKRIFELYGYSPLDTPILERYEVLSAKYAGGSEILKETFRLKDQGNRELGLRYDLTVPLARFIAMNPMTKMPFKRYQIGEVFRDGPIKPGRTRQFMQCDADTVGAKSIYSDAECIKIALDVFKALKLDVRIEVGSRVLLDSILEKLDVQLDKRLETILILDKLRKIGPENVEKELLELGLSKDLIKNLMVLVSMKGSDEEKLRRLSSFDGASGIKELLQVINNKSVVFNPSLSRGLGYYTGPIFEVFLKDDELAGSIAAGGRYDSMIGNFVNNKQDYPAVGVSFGMESIMLAMQKKVPLKKCNTSVYVIPINTVVKCIRIADEFRKNDINADLDMNNKGISKNLDYADKLGIPYALIVGSDELQKKKLKLKDMQTGKERMLDIKTIIKILSDYGKKN